MSKTELPENVLKIINTIENAGFEAWCVGGSVRDTVMGKVPDDYDIASSAPCETVMSLFDRVIPTGIKHGTVTVVLDGAPYEITRYRIDGEYNDSRRPDDVEFTVDFKKDLSRRDFTVNAIGYHPTRGIFDPFHGIEDIKNGIIRTVGDAKLRFFEDALRIMRAVRFSSVLGFDIEPQTYGAVCSLAKNLKEISSERIAEEFFKTMGGSRPSYIECIINNGGFSRYGINSADISALDKLPAEKFSRTAAFCFLCGVDPAEFCRNLKRSRDIEKKVALQYKIICEKEKSMSLYKTAAGEIGYDLTVSAVGVMGILQGVDVQNEISLLRAAEKCGDPLKISDLALGGEDLRQIGIVGKKIGETLDRLLLHTFENPEDNTKEKLLEIITKETV